MDDLISKQAAIAALGERPLTWVGGDYELGRQNQFDSDLLAIQMVPSVDELEIVTEYCRKRNLVIITIGSFRALQAYYNKQNGMDGD